MTFDGISAASEGPREGLRRMLRLAMPLIIIQLSVTGMQFADALMVAPLGEDALAAVLPAGLVFFLPIAFSMGLLSSVNTFVSQSLGRGDRKGCGRFGGTGLVLAIVCGLAIMPLYFFAEPIFGIFGHSPSVHRLEVIYFQVSLFGSVPFLAGVALSNFFVGIHRPAILAIYAAGATLLNIGLNYVLIYGKFGFPALGLAGSAWGTVLAMSAQTAALALHYFGRQAAATYGTRRIALDGAATMTMLRIGLPSAFQFGFDVLSWGIGLVWLVGIFGTLHLAATTIIVRIMHVSFLPAIGFASVLSAVVGRAVGEGDIALARREANRGFVATVVYMCSVAAVFFIFREPLMRVFTSSPEIIEIGMSLMAIVCAFQFFDGTNIVFSHALRGVGDTFWPAVFTASMCLIIFLGGGWSIAHWMPEWKSSGVWLAAMAYVISLACVMTWRWFFCNWEKRDIMESARP